MRPTSLFATLAIAGMSSAYADDPKVDALEGDWRISTKSASGQPQEARVKIAGQFGFFQLMTAGADIKRSNPCAGLKYPLVATAQADGSLLLVADGSKALVGCGQFTFKLRAAADNTWEGVSQAGFPIRMER